MASADYTPWLGQEMKKLIDLIASRRTPEELAPQIAEIKRGVEYGTNNPGSIDELMLKSARQFVDSLEIYIRELKRKHHPGGIPPGGQATILAGSFASPEESNSDQFSVDELKSALKSRKKKTVETKMKGSLDLLKDYDEV
ncbi:MAG: hypothetical protein ACTSR2_11970 [Candidatus Hodarchaeales archaeon]